MKEVPAIVLAALIEGFTFLAVIALMIAVFKH